MCTQKHRTRCHRSSEKENDRREHRLSVTEDKVPFLRHPPLFRRTTTLTSHQVAAHVTRTSAIPNTQHRQRADAPTTLAPTILTKVSVTVCRRLGLANNGRKWARRVAGTPRVVPFYHWPPPSPPLPFLLLLHYLHFLYLLHYLHIFLLLLNLFLLLILHFFLFLLLYLPPSTTTCSPS